MYAIAYQVVSIVLELNAAQGSNSTENQATLRRGVIGSNMSSLTDDDVWKCSLDMIQSNNSRRPPADRNSALIV